MIDINFFRNLNNNTILIYIIISIFILFFFTSIVDIQLGHIFSVIISVSIIIIITVIKNEDVTNFDTDMEYKLNSLIDHDDYYPDYFYLDVDLINLFYNIKQDLADYNYNTYVNAIKTANNLLHIKYDILRDLCNPPVIQDLSDNFKIIEEEDKECKSILINAYENYDNAEIQLKKCMNYLHSLIISIPSDPITHKKHDILLKRAHILLKRNLDTVKNRYDKHVMKNLSSNTRFISDYDLPKAINKHVGVSSINNTEFGISNFNIF